MECDQIKDHLTVVFFFFWLYPSPRLKHRFRSKHDILCSQLFRKEYFYRKLFLFIAIFVLSMKCSANCSLPCRRTHMHTQTRRKDEYDKEKMNKEFVSGCSKIHCNNKNKLCLFFFFFGRVVVQILYNVVQSLCSSSREK